MAHTFSLSETLQHITSLIETDTGSGTGFIYNLAENDDAALPLLVTNRHVIEGADQPRFLHSSRTIVWIP